MYSPTPWFWNFVGGAAVIMSVGFSYSIIRGSNFKVEAANHKLEINSAIERVKQEVSVTLESSAERVSKKEQKKINNQLKQVDQSLSQVQSAILADTIDEDI